MKEAGINSNEEYHPGMENQAPSKEIKPLTPFQYRNEKSSENIKFIGTASMIVVGYMFLTALLGSFIDFGGIWWAIVFSYIVAITGGIMYCVAKFETQGELIKEYKEEYYSNIKHLN